MITMIFGAIKGRVIQNDSMKRSGIQYGTRMSRQSLSPWENIFNAQ